MSYCHLCTEEHRRAVFLSEKILNNFTVKDAIKQFFQSEIHLLSPSNYDLSKCTICMICFKTLKNFYEFTSQIDERFKDHEIIEYISEKPEDVIEYIEEFYVEEEPEIEKITKEVTEKPRENQPENPEKYNEIFPVPYSRRRAHPKNDVEGDEKIKNFVEMKCNECDEKLDRFIDVTKHFRENHPSIPAYLICCNKKFTKRPNLIEHVEYHDKSANYKCEICNKNFKGKSILRNHIRRFHVDVKDPEMCTECGKYFSNKYTLKTHMKIHLIDENRQFECYICKKSCKNHLKLLDHFKYRHDPAHNRMSICHICSKVVTRLDIHLSTIHSDQPVERVRCNVCGHNLKVTSLRGHMRKHTDQQNFNCPICNQVLKNRNTLSCHIKRVHGEGKFKCEFCDKKYHQQGHLNDHIACQHTGAFLYKCRVDECGKEFRNAGRRGIHERRMHPMEYEMKLKPLYLRDNVEVVEFLNEEEIDGMEVVEIESEN